MRIEIRHPLVAPTARRRILAAGGCLLAALAVAATPQWESPPTLDAAAVLPPELLQGPHHKVAEEVHNDGFLNHFSLTSDSGPFAVQGEDLLRIRVRELEALAALAEVTQTEAFAGAVAEAAAAPITAAAQVVSHPVETVKGLPSGVSNLWKRTAAKIKTTSAKVQESLDQDRSPAGQDDGEGNAAKAKKAAVDATKSYLGVGKSARQWAQKLGVDPYSSNQRLARELERVGEAASVGRFGTRLVMPDLGVVGVLGQVSNLVWTMSAADLEVRNRKRLQETGLGKAEIDTLLANPAYSPTRVTGLVAALDELAGVPGGAHLMRSAGAAASEEEALFFVRSAQLLSVYHADVAPFAGIVPGGGWVGGKTAAGAAVMTLAVDYLPWTEEAAVALGDAAGRFRAEAGVERLELWVAGQVSHRAGRELEALGWTVTERVRGRLHDAATASSGR